MNFDWIKEAIQGATYARVLQNAATRGGRELSPAMQSKVTQLHAQPQAKLQPGLGQTFREHAGGGALTPTPQQADMQKMLAKTPWAGAEHGGTAHAESTYNALLRRRGLDQRTPGGAAATNAQIQQQFGAPKRPHEAGETQVKRTKQTGPDPLMHLDMMQGKTPRTPGAGQLGPADTHVGPAPAAGPARGVAGTAMPAGPAQETSRQTVVSHGQWKPRYQRLLPQQPVRARPPGFSEESTAVLGKTGAFLTGLEALLARCA